MVLVAGLFVPASLKSKIDLIVYILFFHDSSDIIFWLCLMMERNLILIVGLDLDIFLQQF
jgi:hypothetical protein